MTTFNRIGLTIVLTLALMATTLAGTVGIANASPSASGGQGGVNFELCQESAGMGQTWARLNLADAPGWAVKNGKVITATNQAELDRAFPYHTTVVDTVKGGKTIGGGGVDEGDYAVLISNGTDVYVLPDFITVVGGQDNHFGGYCGRIGKNGTKANTATGKSGGTAAKAKKAAPVVLTPLCQAALPVAKTGGKAYVLKTGPFQGKVAFVLATNTSVLSVEAAEHMFKAGGDNAVVIDFTGVGNGDAVEIASGAYQVFNVEPTGGLTPLGFMNAHPVTQPANRTPAQIVTWINGVAHTDVDRKNATCMKYDVSLLAADPGRTGSDDFPGGLAGIVLAGLAGFALLFYYLVLPMLARLRTQTVTVIG